MVSGTIEHLPLSESGNVEETFMQGKQSTLLSSALKKSKTIKATKAVTCRRKSRRTANAAKGKTKELRWLKNELEV